jgi:hypothetical protein
MSPRQPTSYRPPKDRRELMLAVFAVAGILIFTIAMVVLLAPPGADTPTVPPVSLPTTVPGSVTTLPGETVPGATVPGATSETTASSAPAG